MDKIEETRSSSERRSTAAGRTGRLVVAAVLVTATALISGLVAAPAEAATATRVVVTASVCRVAPSPSAHVKAKVARSQRVTVTGARTGWVRTTKGWLPAAKVSTANHYADAVAASKGMRVRYTNNQTCGRRASVNTATRFVASGCYREGDGYVQLTRSAAYSGSAAWKRTVIRDLVLHESAHAAIYRKTGSVAPRAAAGRSEQVTDAYAWYFYRTTSKAPGGYGFSSADLARARKIHG
jgi:hypothetical protein